MTDQFAGHENAGHENAEHENGGPKMTTGRKVIAMSVRLEMYSLTSRAYRVGRS